MFLAQSKKMNLTHPLILASNSPRRQQILRDAGFDFEIYTMEVNEDFDSEMDVRRVAEHLAAKKNQAYHNVLRDKIIVTSDTTVVYDQYILNKPADSTEAMEMLRALSGKRHEVITGVATSLNGNTTSFSDVTYVDLKVLSEAEIDFYVKHYQPLDKAGAYGIQEWIGMIGVEKIEGSFYNVVGLPIHRVYQELMKFQAL